MEQRLGLLHPPHPRRWNWPSPRAAAETCANPSTPWSSAPWPPRKKKECAPSPRNWPGRAGPKKRQQLRPGRRPALRPPFRSAKVHPRQRRKCRRVLPSTNFGSRRSAFSLPAAAGDCGRGHRPGLSPGHPHCEGLRGQRPAIRAAGSPDSSGGRPPCCWPPPPSPTAPTWPWPKPSRDVQRGLGRGFPRQLQNVHYDGEDQAVKGQHYLYPHDYPRHWVKQAVSPRRHQGPGLLPVRGKQNRTGRPALPDLAAADPTGTGRERVNLICFFFTSLPVLCIITVIVTRFSNLEGVKIMYQDLVDTIGYVRKADPEVGGRHEPGAEAPAPGTSS